VREREASELKYSAEHPNQSANLTHAFRLTAGGYLITTGDFVPSFKVAHNI